MIRTRDRLKELVGKIEGVQALMIAYVTGERADTQPADYQESYYQLAVDLEELGYANPNQHRSLESFWSFCKLKELNSYASRRSYVKDLYADVLLDVERALRKTTESRNWQQDSLQVEVDEATAFGSARHIPQVGRVETQNDIERLLSTLIQGLPRAMYPMQNRRRGAPCMQFDNEYDVQDLLHTLLRPWIKDIRPEEYMPSYAGSSARIDFVLADHSIVIEVKYVRDPAHAKKIGDELIIDIARYRAHPQCRQLWIVVYDSGKFIRNPDGLVSDLKKHSENIKVCTFILY